MDRGHGIDGDGQREPGRSPAGRIASSTASRAARAVPAAGASMRRPLSLRCPTSTSGRSSPFPLPANQRQRPRENCRNPRATRPAEPGALAVLDPATAGGTMIGQARRSRDCRRRPEAEIESRNYWCRDVGPTRTEGRIITLKSARYGNPCRLAREAFVTGWYGAATTELPPAAWSAEADVGVARRNPVPYRGHRDVLRADAPPMARRATPNRRRARSDQTARWLPHRTSRGLSGNRGTPRYSMTSSRGAWRCKRGRGRSLPGRADEPQRWHTHRAETGLAATVGRPTRPSRRIGRQA